MNCADQSALADEGLIDKPLGLQDAGIVRTRVGMQEAIRVLEGVAARVAHPRTRRAHEAANLHLASMLVARSALGREESRGSHFRSDFPDVDPAFDGRHLSFDGLDWRFESLETARLRQGVLR